MNKSLLLLSTMLLVAQAHGAQVGEMLCVGELLKEYNTHSFTIALNDQSIFIDQVNGGTIRGFNFSAFNRQSFRINREIKYAEKRWKLLTNIDSANRAYEIIVDPQIFSNPDKSETKSYQLKLRSHGDEDFGQANFTCEPSNL